MKKHITHPDFEQFAEQYSTPEDALLYRIYRETHVRRLNPRMITGHLQGLLLKQISWMLRPKQILEIGTFTGYSAICLATGLADGGKLITVDSNPEIEDIARHYFEESGYSHQISILIGEAVQIIPSLQQQFDLVYIDADKENYLNYFKLVFDRVRKNGFIIADNVLWDGKVLEKGDKDAETSGIAEFNAFVREDSRIEKVMLPIRDGIFLIRKLI